MIIYELWLLWTFYILCKEEQNFKSMIIHNPWFNDWITSLVWTWELDQSDFVNESFRLVLKLVFNQLIEKTDSKKLVHSNVFSNQLMNIPRTVRADVRIFNELLKFQFIITWLHMDSFYSYLFDIFELQASLNVNVSV